MGLETRDKLMALDVGCGGAPYCEIGAQTGLSFLGMDWGFQGGPFVSLADEGVAAGFNARVKVAGSFIQVAAGQVMVSGAWKTIAAMKVMVGGSWKAV
jgi:hypothetical protein